MDQDELLRHVVATLERLHVPYLVTGSVATIFYGEPRFTNDIDIVVQLEPGEVDALVSKFPGKEFYVSREAAQLAVQRAGQFNVIHPGSGLKVDFVIPTMDAFDHSRFRRGRRVRVAPDYEATFASPEDVILKKLQFFRSGESEKHLRDCAGVLRITSEVDRAYISRWADELGVEELWRRVQLRADEASSDGG
jgi:hypothetical protein